MRKKLVIHVAIHPISGPWTVIRRLVEWQKAQADIIPFVFLYLRENWPDYYLEQLKQMSIEFDTCSITAWKMRGWYLRLYLSNDIKKFANRLADRYLPEKIFIHFHTNMLTGLFLPLQINHPTSLSLTTTFHGAIAEHWQRSEIRTFVHKWLIEKTARYTHVVSVDDFTPQTLEKYLGVQAADFRVIHTGLPETSVRGCPGAKDPHAPLTVGFVGILNESKGWRLAAEAVAQLAGQGLPIRIVFAGNGPDTEVVADWTARHQSFADFKGYVTNVYDKLYLELDVLVLPSRTEGLPMSVLETMSCGIPCMATAVGGLPKLIEHKKTGFLVKRDTADIASRLLLLVTNREHLRLMSECCIDRHRKYFSMQQCGQAYSQVYNIESQQRS